MVLAFFYWVGLYIPKGYVNVTFCTSHALCNISRMLARDWGGLDLKLPLGNDVH